MSEADIHAKIREHDLVRLYQTHTHVHAEFSSAALMGRSFEDACVALIKHLVAVNDSQANMLAKMLERQAIIIDILALTSNTPE